MSESNQPLLPRIKLINYLKFYNFPREAVALHADNTSINPSRYLILANRKISILY